MSLFVATTWVFACTALFTLLLAIVAGVRGQNRIDIVSGGLCQVVAYSVVLFAILRVHAPDSGIRELLGLRPTSIAFFPLAAVYGVAAQFPAGAIAWAILERFPIANDGNALLHASVLAARPFERVMIALMVCGLGPLVEEVLFRGAIFGPLKKRLGNVEIIAFTSILFAAVHLQWQTFLPIALLGAGLGLFRLWSGSLVVSVLAHSAFNAVTLYSMTFPPPEVDEPPHVAFVVAGTFFVALSLFLTWFIGRRSDVAKQARELDA